MRDAVSWNGSGLPSSRSGDPRRAAELARGGGAGQDQGPNGPGQVPAGLGNLGGGLPEGFSQEDLAEQLSKMPSGGLNFPPQGPQGNIPAAFRGGGNKRKKK